MARLLALNPRDLWALLVKQNVAFWALSFYLIVEYVRPQQLIPSLSVLPWGNITILLTLAAFLATGNWFRTRTVAATLMLVYLAVILASTATAFSSDASIAKWKVFFTWLLIFYLITNIVINEERFFLFMLMWLAYNFYMAQGATRQFAGRGFSYQNYGVKGAPGWFDNSGEFGIEMCVYLPLAWHFYKAARPYLKAWWKKAILIAGPVTALIGIVGSSSRGAQLGAAMVGLWILMHSKQRAKALVVLSVAFIALWALMPQQQRARFNVAGDDTTSTRRITYWKNGLEMTRRHPLLGVGYGNWQTYYLTNFVDRRARVSGSLGYVQVSHNIFIECMAELGLVGLAVFLSLIIATLVVNARTRKLARAGPAPDDYLVQMAYGLDAALVGYLVSGFFVTVLYYPYFWINLAFTVCLHTAAQRRSLQLPARVSPVPVPQMGVPVPATAGLPSGRRKSPNPVVSRRRR